MKRYLVIFVVMTALSCVTTANNTCPEKKEGQFPPAKEVNKPLKEIKLTSVLYELTIAPDKERFAQEHDIFLYKGTVRVFISFDPASSDSERKKLFPIYNIIVEKRANNLFRALVPIDSLMPLSKESSIWSIRLPDKPIQ